MMYTALLVAAASFASAQYSYNSTTGVFTCPANALNGDFCAGESLQTNIIIRCTNGVGQPGNCNDNLAGYFPNGVNYAPCWQTSNTTGDAACSKNCIVEGSSGNSNGTFTLAGCTPSSASSTASSTTSSASVSTTSSGSVTTTVTTIVTSTSTSTSTSSLSTATLSPSGGSTVSSNGTLTTTSTSASKTVTGPTTSSSNTQFTGAANAMGVSSGAGLAGFGLLVAYFL